MDRTDKTVFLSYRRTDRGWALSIYNWLTTHGFDVFFDEAALGSGTFQGDLMEGIAARAHFLVLLSPGAIDEMNADMAGAAVFRREIERALALRRNVVPMALEGFRFDHPTSVRTFSGALAPLLEYNLLSMDTFEESMQRLVRRFLEVDLTKVSHPDPVALSDNGRLVAMSRQSPPRIRVGVIDDHALIRRGICDTLREAPDLNVVAEGGDGPDALKMVRGGIIDVLLLDVNMPGRSGLDILIDVREVSLDLPVLIVSMYPEHQLVRRVVAAGANGYVNKGADPRLVIDAIRTVIAGRSYFTRTAGVPPEIEADRPLHERLSEREHAVLLHIAQGRSLKEISELMTLSPKTVSVYRARVLEQMHMTSNQELIVYAVKNGLAS